MSHAPPAPSSEACAELEDIIRDGVDARQVALRLERLIDACTPAQRLPLYERLAGRICLSDVTGRPSCEKVFTVPASPPLLPLPPTAAAEAWAPASGDEKEEEREATTATATATATATTAAAAAAAAEVASLRALFLESQLMEQSLLGALAPQTQQQRVGGGGSRSGDGDGDDKVGLWLDAPTGVAAAAEDEDDLLTEAGEMPAAAAAAAAAASAEGLLDAAIGVVAPCLCTDEPTSAHLVRHAKAALDAVADSGVPEEVAWRLREAVAQCFSMFKVCPQNERLCASLKENIREAKGELRHYRRRNQTAAAAAAAAAAAPLPRAASPSPQSTSSEGSPQLPVSASSFMAGSPASPVEASAAAASPESARIDALFARVEETRLSLEVVRSEKAFVDAASDKRLQATGVRTSARLLRQRIESFRTHLDGMAAKLQEQRQDLHRTSTAQLHDMVAESRSLAAHHRGEAHQKLLVLEEKKAALRKELEDLCEQEMAVKRSISEFERLKTEIAKKEAVLRESLQRREDDIDVAERLCGEERRQIDKVYDFVKRSHNIANEVVSQHKKHSEDALQATCTAFFSHAHPHLQACLDFVSAVRQKIEACTQYLKGHGDGHGDDAEVARCSRELKEAAGTVWRVLQSAMEVERDMKGWDKQLSGKHPEKVRQLAGEIVVSLTGLGKQKTQIAGLAPEFVPVRKVSATATARRTGSTDSLEPSNSPTASAR